MIFLSSPYSDPDPDVRQQRFVAACHAAANLMLAGEVVYSPIVHGHAMAEVADVDAMDHAMWMAQCLPILTRADAVAVLMLDGWRESSGVRQEIDAAQAQDIEIFFLEA